MTTQEDLSASPSYTMPSIVWGPLPLYTTLRRKDAGSALRPCRWPFCFSSVKQGESRYSYAHLLGLLPLCVGEEEGAEK